MCDFCPELSRTPSGRSRIIQRHDGFFLLPTLGCFTDGYNLILPFEHRPSFAVLGRDQLTLGLQFAEGTRKRLARFFGDYLIAEHGALDSGDLGAGCCLHAHLHLIPMPRKLGLVRAKYVAAGGPPYISGDISSFEGVRGRSYLMLSTKEGKYEFWLATHKFQRQFVRSVCAELLGIGRFYNWREHHFTNRMLRTKLICEAILADNLRIPSAPSYAAAEPVDVSP
jgi:hypothetical protein